MFSINCTTRSEARKVQQEQKAQGRSYAVITKIKDNLDEVTDQNGKVYCWMVCISK